MGRAVPQPSWMVLSIGEKYVDWKCGSTYLNNLIAFEQLVDIFPWAAIEEDAGQVDGALPGLEAAFVDTGPNVRISDVVESLIVGCFVFCHQLHADVGQVSAW